MSVVDKKLEDAFVRQRFEKELLRRRTHKQRVARRNRNRAQSYYLQKKPNVIYTPIKAPSIFSFFDNRDKTIAYFKNVKTLIGANTYTRMDLSKIESIDLPTLCFLSSFMLDGRTEADYLIVDIPPKSSPQHKIFREGQFEQMIMTNKRALFTNGNFLSRSDKNINKDYIEDVLKKSLKYFGVDSRKKLQNLSPIIMEIVTNTSNHAKPDKRNRLPWLINTLEVEKEGKKYKEYCIVDLGVGIYSSISDKTEQFKSQRRKLVSWMHDIAGKTQCQFFSANVPGGIQSTTALPERGKGIKFIYDEAQNPIYKKFEVITNKAHINLLNIKQVNKDSLSNLEATIYYWEICLE